MSFQRLLNTLLVTAITVFLSACTDDGKPSPVTPTNGQVIIVNNSIFAFNANTGTSRKLADIDEGLFVELNTSIDPDPEEDEDASPIGSDPEGFELENDVENQISDYDILVDASDFLAYVSESVVYILNSRSGLQFRLARFENQVCSIESKQAPDTSQFFTSRNRIININQLFVAISPLDDCDIEDYSYFTISYQITSQNLVTDVDVSPVTQSLSSSQLIIPAGNILVSQGNTHGYLGYSDDNRELQYFNENLAPVWTTDLDYSIEPPTFSENTLLATLVQVDNEIYIMSRALLLELAAGSELGNATITTTIPQDQIFVRPAITLDIGEYMPINSDANESAIVFEYGDGLYLFDGSTNRVEKVHDRLPGLTYTDFLVISASNIIIAHVEIGGESSLIAVYPETKAVETLLVAEIGDFTNVLSELFINTAGSDIETSQAILFDEEMNRTTINGSQWAIFEQRNKNVPLIYIITEAEDSEDGPHLFEYDGDKLTGGFDLGPVSPDLPVLFGENEFITNDIGMIGYLEGSVDAGGDFPNISIMTPDERISTLTLTSP